LSDSEFPKEERKGVEWHIDEYYTVFYYPCADYQHTDWGRVGTDWDNSGMHTGVYLWFHWVPTVVICQLSATHTFGGDIEAPSPMLKYFKLHRIILDDV
jgi:hypothetical protein